jgi:3-oxoacyl-[acyl-carrier-protein] synthase III
MQVYINSVSKYLPGDPVDNDSMEEFVGAIHGKPSRVRSKILRQNGIQTRYYAIDRDQNTVVSNAAMAANAVRGALERAGLDLEQVDFLAATTAQGDLPLPGFASMVHGELKSPPCEIATLHGICASGVMALKSGMMQILHGDKHHAVVCASELIPR